jgi:hypothetical protein
VQIIHPKVRKFDAGFIPVALDSEKQKDFLISLQFTLLSKY